MFIAAMVIAGWAALYLGLREVLTRKCDEIRREFAEEVNLLYMKIRLLDCDIAERLAAGPAPQAAMPEAPEVGTTKQADLIPWPAPASATASEEVSPEVMAVLSETVTGCLGKRVGIRSARKISSAASVAQPPAEIAEPWSQQGRVLVQSSHRPVHDRAVGTAASFGSERDGS